MIRISDEKLFNISPTKVEFYLEYLSGNEYHFFNLSGHTEKGGANHTLLYLDQVSLEKWIYWYENVLKQKYGGPPQFQLTGQTSCANKFERSIFGEGCNYSIIITKINKGFNLMKITNLVKKILDEDTRKLVKAGFINGDLALTDEGVQELLGLLFLQNKAELVKIAEEKNAEAH